MSQRKAAVRPGLVATVALALVLVFAWAGPAQAFPDVPAGHAYEAAINGLASLGIIGGYPNGDFGLNDPVKRAQFAKMVVGTLSIPVNTSTVTRFTDLGAPDANGYPHKFVQTAYDHGITNGTNAAQTLFAPWKSIRRDQVVSMIVRGVSSVVQGTALTPPGGTQSLFDGVGEPHGANLRIAEYIGLLDGLIGIGPGWSVTANATRGEVAKMLWNLRDFLNSNPPPSGEVWVYEDGTGDYPTIEAAVANIEPDTTIYLGPGDFDLSDTLLVNIACELAGSGMDGPDTTRVFCPKNVVEISSCTFSASDIQFLGSGTGAPTNIMEADDAVLTLTRCVFGGGVNWSGYEGSGLSLSGNTTANVTDCIFAGNDLNGIEALEYAALIVDNSSMIGNGQNGVMFHDDSTGLVSLSDCSTNDLNGISVLGDAEVDLVGNTCSNCGGNGIYFGNDTIGDVVGNTCNGNLVDGISCHDTAGVVLENNICRGNTEDGITCGESVKATIRGNECSYTQQYDGIDVHGSAHAVVENNLCLGNSHAGIWFGGSATGSASGNECADNYYGVLVDATAAPTLGTNNLHNNIVNLRTGA